MRNLILRSLPVLLLAACVSAPPCETRSTDGIVRAFSFDEARRVHELASTASPRVARILETNGGSFEIHVLDEPLGRGQIRTWHDRDGRVRKRRILLGRDDRPDLPFVVAHELGHWHAVGPWERLPHLVEEGLAEWVALSAVPELAEDRRAFLREIVEAHEWSGWRTMIELGIELWDGPPGGPQLPGYALGTFLVDRIGVEGLRALCLEAEARGLVEVPIEALLERARLTESAVPGAIVAWAATLPEPRFEFTMPVPTPAD